MQRFKRGDIVRQRVLPFMRYDYFHVEHVHDNGALDVIADSTGKPAGLSSHHGGVELATLSELLKHREARLARSGAIGGGG